MPNNRQNTEPKLLQLNNPFPLVSLRPRLSFDEISILLFPPPPLSLSLSLSTWRSCFSVAQVLPAAGLLLRQHRGPGRLAWYELSLRSARVLDEARRRSRQVTDQLAPDSGSGQDLQGLKRRRKTTSDSVSFSIAVDFTE